MLNFIFYNPTKIIFGKGQIAKLQDEILRDARILMIYGGGSIKANGVYDQVKSSLKQHTMFEFAGIEPNPVYDTLMRAVDLVHEKNIDFLLAVGGGSVIDGTKFIASAAFFEGDPWDILAKQLEVKKALPIGTVLTLPAAGSEMNRNAVVSKGNQEDKLSFHEDVSFPKFSILDPTVTFTLPPNQTANGIVDTFVHVMEQYLTYPVNSPLQDGFAEGILRVLIQEAPLVMRNPQNYDARANIMWCSTLGLNGLIAAGVPSDWATHRIGHEITARFGLDHAVTLAIILPNLMAYKRENKQEKILQYGERVWNITEGDVDSRIDQAVIKTREFFEGLGVKTKLSDYGITAEKIPLLLKQLEKHGMVALGEKQDIDLRQSEGILRMSL